MSVSSDLPLDQDQIILATAGYDYSIKLWHTHHGVCLRTLQHAESQVNTLEIAPNRNLLAAAGYQHIRMYDLQSSTANFIADYEADSRNVTSIGFQSEGKWMYSGGEDKSVKIWDLRTSNVTCPKSFKCNAPVNCVTLHPNQGELFIGDQMGNIYRFDLRTDCNEQLIPDGQSMILDIDITKDGTEMAVVNSKGRCFIWSLISGIGDVATHYTPKHRFQAHKRQILTCKYSPNASILVTTSADQTAKLWNTSDYELLQELKQENQRWVWDAAFSADSQYVFTASSDSMAKLWNVKTGQLERQYAGHTKTVTSIAFRDVIAD
ncbi:target of rapamycin complex subunit lst8 isoform X2 [Onthophagus taurus]|uniref:target of rapamycin complex subunit lst8 isoform X2 n=1 Tax=Onthophagus taurus TaxID=166361 RepID=UPI000C2056E7|nr:target of rapamycin complex subunit lst8 isoform X2 [Onthophagus taurus]